MGKSAEGARWVQRSQGEQYINKYQKEKKKDTHIYIQLVLLYT
jgi:hypothetical protein